MSRLCLRRFRLASRVADQELVKIAYVDDKLLVEVHPPVDGEGQVAQIDPEVLSKKLHAALGQDTAAIHWEFTRKALEAATGVPTVVGVRAHVAQASEVIES